MTTHSVRPERLQERKQQQCNRLFSGLFFSTSHQPKLDVKQFRSNILPIKAQQASNLLFAAPEAPEAYNGTGSEGFELSGQ